MTRIIRRVMSQVYFYPRILKQMSIIFLLILFSLILAIAFLFAFIWSVKDGQFDDDYTPSVRILFDDEKQNNLNTKEEL